MANVTKDSYDETNNFSAVIFQLDNEVQDYELNEMQSNIRISNQRAIASLANDGSRSAGSSDDGFLFVSSGTTAGTLKAGTVVLGGLHYKLSSDLPQTVTANGSSAFPRRILVYLRVVESEVVDPNQNNDLGETTRRKKVEVTVNYSYGTSSSNPQLPVLPADTPADIWAGGVRYYAIADLLQAGNTVPTNIVATDLRTILAPRLISQITRRMPFDSASTFRKVEGVWQLTCGDGTNTFGDFNGSSAVTTALNWIWEKIRTGSGERYSFHLHVKAGTYAFAGWRTTDAGGPITRMWDLKITGDGGIAREGIESAYKVNGTILAITSGTVALLGSSGQDRTNVSLENITFNSTNGTLQMAALDFIGARSIRATNVVFDGVQVRAESRGSRFLFSGCTFAKWNEAYFGDASLFNFFMTGGRLDTLVFDTCVINTRSTTNPVNFLGITPQPNGQSQVGLLKLVNCGIVLIGALSSASEGSHAAQRGIFRIIPTSDWVDCTIESVVIEDCNVRSSTSQSTSAFGTCLLDWHAGGGSVGTSIVNRQVRCGKFTVRGGLWQMTVGQNQKFPAFRIQGWDAFQDANGPDVTLDGIRLNISVDGLSARYADVANQGVDSASAAYNGGLIYVAGKTVTLRDITIDGYVENSTSGEMALFAQKYTKIDGIRLYGSGSVGGGTRPRTRINLNGPDSDLVSVRDIEITGTRKISATTDFGGFFQLPGKANRTIVDGVVWDGATLEGSPMFYLTAERNYIGLKIANCSILAIGGGGSATPGKALRARVSGAVVNKLDIVGNVFKGALVEVLAEATGEITHAHISGNLIDVADNPDAVYGLFLRQRASQASRYAVTDNVFYTLLTQYAVVWGENDYDFNSGVFSGNSARQTSGGQGRVVFRPDAGTIRGVELAGATELNAAAIVPPVAGVYSMAFNNVTLVKE